jgi:hypothetical protein
MGRGKTRWFAFQIDGPVSDAIQCCTIRSDNIELESFLTDANIDASCHRTHYGSNWVICVGKSISTLYN